MNCQARSLPINLLGTVMVPEINICHCCSAPEEYDEASPCCISGSPVVSICAPNWRDTNDIIYKGSLRRIGFTEDPWRDWREAEGIDIICQICGWHGQSAHVRAICKKTMHYLGPTHVFAVVTSSPMWLAIAPFMFHFANSKWSWSSICGWHIITILVDFCGTPTYIFKFY